jgi:hypothetical protein
LDAPSPLPSPARARGRRQRKRDSGCTERRRGYKSLAELDGKKVGSVVANLWTDELKNAFGANFAYQDGEAVFSDLAAKRIDAVVDNRRPACRGVFGRFVPTGVAVAHFSHNVKTMTAAAVLARPVCSVDRRLLKFRRCSQASIHVCHERRRERDR